MIKNLYKDFVYFVIFVMKKIIWYVMFIISLFFVWNVAFWQWSVEGGWNWCWEVPEWMYCCDWTITNVDCDEIVITPDWPDWGWNRTCDPERVYTISKWLTWCCPSPLVDWKCDAVRYDDMWINISTDCLLRGWCSLNVYKVMWIRKSNENPTVWGFFQDIVLAATTFVWTVIVIALIVSGLIFAVWSISWKDTKKAKTILIDCFVWLLLVMWSYTIIRLIQFVATAWS